MPNYLSWNVYHGAIAGQTPSQRIVQIVNVGMQNNVDVICLQECPQNILDNTIGAFGTPGAGSPIVGTLNANVGGWGAYYSLRQAWSENNPNNPNSAVTADGYLIFYRNATYAGNGAFGYYQANTFKDLIGNYLRAPVSIQLNLVGGGAVTVMNWHANTGAPQVLSANAALNTGLSNWNPQNLCVVLGDFNYGGPLNNLFVGIGVPFPNWDDWFVNVTNNAGQSIAAGLDHILTNQPAMSILANVLTFKSDAYHYPLAVNV